MEMANNMQMVIITVIIPIVIFIGASIITTEAAEGVLQVCPSGYDYELTTNKCYKMYATYYYYHKTWEDSRKHCQQEGGDLIVVRDQASNSIIPKLVQKYQVSGTMPMWIGLREIGNDKDNDSITFRWVDDTDLIFQNWAMDASLERQDCVVQHLIKKEWYGVTCLSLYAYICERPLDINPSCPHGVVSNVKNNKCNVAVVRYKKTFEEWRNEFRLYGGHLASLSDADTRELIVDLINNTMEAIPRYWIGLWNPYSDEDKPFEWLDGTPLDYSDPTVGFPFGMSEFCATFTLERGKYVYLDHDCKGSFQSIFEKNMTKVYPVFGCPHGYVTHIEDDLDTTCLMFQNNKPRSLSDASDDCSRMNARLLIDQQDELDYAWLSQFNLITSSDLYWAKQYPCETVNFDEMTFENASCRSQHPYICQHWGEIRVVADLQKLGNMIDEKDVLLWDDGEIRQRTYLTDLCQSSKETGVIVLGKWASTNLLLWTEQGDDIKCHPQDTQIECCDEITVSNPQFLEDSVVLKVYITVERLHCLCLGVTTNKPTTVMSTTLIATTYTSTTVKTTTYHSTTITPTTYNSTTIKSTTVTPTTYTPTTLKRTTYDSTTVKPTTYDSTTVKPTAYTPTTVTPTTITPTPYNSTTFKPITYNLTTVTRTTKIPTTVKPTTGEPATVKPTTNELTTSGPQKCYPITQETFDLLRNMTHPTNGSTAPNNLCPCRCDRMAFDLNPSPEILSQIIFRIQTELKVETVKLSSMRNKKISAQDSRVGCQVLGYVGIALCLVPVILIAAFDISRIIAKITYR